MTRTPGSVPSHCSMRLIKSSRVPRSFRKIAGSVRAKHVGGQEDYVPAASQHVYTASWSTADFPAPGVPMTRQFPRSFSTASTSASTAGRSILT